MESLRTKLDNLQWEVNRLDAENRRLRDGDPEASSCVDLEAELQHSKAETAQLAERVRMLEEQLAEARAAAEGEEREDEERTTLGQRLADTQRQLEEATEELQRTRVTVSELCD